jgi:hypothetical protein
MQLGLAAHGDGEPEGGMAPRIEGVDAERYAYPPVTDTFRFTPGARTPSRYSSSSSSSS